MGRTEVTPSPPRRDGTPIADKGPYRFGDMNLTAAAAYDNDDPEAAIRPKRRSHSVSISGTAGVGRSRITPRLHAGRLALMHPGRPATSALG